MNDSSNTFCTILFDVLTSHGIKDVVCSPGSRNVPLLLAAAARPSLKKHFAVDERCAAFMALGMALVKRSPVALVCTSGTALLDYAPAIAEAYYQGIPLIVISADRPIQWIDQDDSQTMRQDGALANFVKQSYSLPAFGYDLKEMQWYADRLVNDAVIKACGGKPGPVHINIHLSEPLNGTSPLVHSEPRIINEIIGDSIVNKETIKHLADIIAESKVMFVAGFGLPDASLQKAVTTFSRFPNVVVMAETISNLHLKESDYSIDSVLTAYPDSILDQMAPDIIISIGGALVSRKLKEYLRKNSDKCRHWSLGYGDTVADPFMSLVLRLQLNPYHFLRSLNSALKKLKISSTYRDRWLDLRKEAIRKKNLFIDSQQWAELKAFALILRNIPENFNLFLSNGTPVRYAQIINYPLPHASYCNRGVSGIDGSVSTAIGGAYSYKGRTILVTGDLSMAYDLGSLGLPLIPDRFKIIVIDNQGGGIFRFIPSTSTLPLREEYLCMPPVLPLEQLTKGYNWNYYECHEEASFQSVFNDFISDSNKSILKISCDGIKSAEILKNYMKVPV